jgi:hypothetical protein
MQCCWQQRVPFRNPVGLRSLGVLVNEATEDLAATYPPRVQLSDWWWERLTVGWALPAALMRAMPVVVRQVLAEYSQQVSNVIDQNRVQALSAYRAYPAFRVGVRPGRLRRYEEYLDALGAEHRVDPGLFQTAEYSAAMLSYFVDFLEAPDDVEQAVEARMERQRVIYTGDRRFVVVVEEQVLRARVGTVDTMAGQLDRVLGIMSLPRVSLGVIPATVPRTVFASVAFGSTTTPWSVSRHQRLA